MLEQLNHDIIYIICSYMDLASLANLAAVYPQWSDVIWRPLKTRIWALDVIIHPQNLTLRYQSLSKPGKGLYKSVTIEDEFETNLRHCKRLPTAPWQREPFRLKDTTAIGITHSESKNFSVNGHWEELPKAFWTAVPFHLMNIALVDVEQSRSSELTTGIVSLLSTVTTKQLDLNFETRGVARKVLQAISLDPGSTVIICEHWFPFANDKEPILQHANLANVKHLWFGGDMLPDDLSLLLNSDISSLFLISSGLQKSCVTIVKEYVKRFLDGKVAQKSCRIGSYKGVEDYLLERLGNREKTLSNGPRKVHLHSGDIEEPFNCYIDFDVSL
ncbi:hypothetical protein V3C99_003820 [Haemonchus contortus]